MCRPADLRRRVGRGFAALSAAVLLLGVAAGTADAQSKRLTVVELFTSQGCSSCPPADALLGRLAERDGILALSLHVDYWDYIGWRDPFAMARNTERQYAYMRAFQRSYVYTPQMVVQGVAQATGSDEDAVEAALAEARSVDRVSVSLKRLASGSVEVSVGAREGLEDAGVYLVLFAPRAETEIRRGENRGRTLVNHNIVQRFERIAEWRGAALDVTVPASALDAGHECAVVVQEEPVGPIYGAALLDVPPATSAR